jgi:transposase InsO family protein
VIQLYFNYYRWCDHVHLVALLNQKADAGQRLHEFIRWQENQSGKSLKVIVRDGGKEYAPAKEKRFARLKGIDIRESAPRTPEQNGKAEIVGRHIVETARATRINAGLPEFL